MNKYTLHLLVVALFLSLTSFAKDASSLENAASEVKANKFMEAAKSYYSFYKDNKKAKEADLSLAMTGRLLDHLKDQFTEKAEKKCYWAKTSPMSPSCMQKEASDLNDIFGKDSFEYTGGVSLAYLEYKGHHYQIILDSFKKSPYRDESEFYLLLQNLRGHPDIVVPKVKSFMNSHKSGIWNKRALLLWARLNQDIWHVWKKWTWVVYNRQISEDELIIKAEPYRQEALRTYKELFGKGDFFSTVAKVEYGQLERQEDDGALYTITNDSTPGTWDKWGLSLLD